MPTAAPPPEHRGPQRDHAFHALRVGDVTVETEDACSITLEVPAALRELFSYRAGQFCTFRVSINGDRYERCYSMSSAPVVDDQLRVTVKRVPDGIVSNWLNDEVAPGSELEVSAPGGLFQLREGRGHLVAFAAGSGITPVFSILKTALATSSRPVRLLYANRDHQSIIFADALERLQAEFPDRLTVIHHLDVDHGYVDADEVISVLDGTNGAEIYLCGPTPFMDVVEQSLLDHGVDADRLHLERFAPLEAAEPEPAGADEATGTEVTIELKGRSGTVVHRPGTTLLQTAREAGLSPPFSCEAGNCASCMAQIVDGAARMRMNNALTPAEVQDGWVLTCQAVPTSAKVHVVYE